MPPAENQWVLTLEPGRSSGDGGSWFQAFIDLLKSPIFEDDGKESGINAAVRNFITSRNEHMRALAQEARKWQ